MNDLQPGDQIEIVFIDAPGLSAKATISRFMSDQQEGLSPEAEDYVFGWLEVSPEHQGALAQTLTIAIRADRKYYLLDGREVEIRKCGPREDSGVVREDPHRRNPTPSRPRSANVE